MKIRELKNKKAERAEEEARVARLKEALEEEKYATKEEGTSFTAALTPLEEDKANEPHKSKRDPDVSRNSVVPLAVIHEYAPLKAGTHTSRATMVDQALTTGLTAEALDTKGG